jgi:hypothetical protein
MQSTICPVCLAKHSRIRLLKRRDYCFDLLRRCSDFIKFTETIRERARDYNQKGIKPMDAQHLAAAVVGQGKLFLQL